MPYAIVQRVLVPAAFILLWSSAYIVVRMGLPDMSPIASLTLRFIIAAIVLLVLSWAAGQPLSALGRSWPHFAVAGTLMNGVYSPPRTWRSSISMPAPWVSSPRSIPC